MVSANCGYPDPAQGYKFLVLYGPELLVNVGFDPKYKSKLNAPPTPGISSIEALVDTGAEESCIDSSLAAQLKLPIVDTRPVGGVSGTLQVNMHLAQIHVPVLKFTAYGAFAGVHLIAGGFRQRVLLGRTFLRHFTMHYDGKSGAVTISS